jgi:membrane-bound lytic murein transglycosylase B
MFLRFLSTKREVRIGALRDKCFVLIGFLASALVAVGPATALGDQARARSGAKANEPADYRSSARVFATEVAERHGFDPAALTALMDRARYRQDVIDAMRRPYEGRPWAEYRPIFLTQARIADGLAFWQAQADSLRRAEQEYGVPPEVVVAIIGVETSYGGNLGKHRVLDALSTLGFAYPPRADFFRGELEQFLLLTRDEAIDPLRVTGSYAGAVGKPQFIPSSYREFAVDFDGDGRRDLWRSDADVIGSVANYLQRHGWRPGEDVALAATLAEGAEAALAEAGVELAEKRPVKPQTAAALLRSAGVSTTAPLNPDAAVTLLRLDGKGDGVKGGRSDSATDGQAQSLQDEYWVALENFYVLTRYNRSNLYAMAVYQLGREIKALYLAREPRQAAAQ